MDEPKKSTPSAADIGSEAHTGIPKAGTVTPGTTPNAADLTENELEDVVGGFTPASGNETLIASGASSKTAKTGGSTIFSGSGM
jgi:hypothetical protein